MRQRFMRMMRLRVLERWGVGKFLGPIGILGWPREP